MNFARLQKDFILAYIKGAFRIESHPSRYDFVCSIPSYFAAMSSKFDAAMSRCKGRSEMCSLAKKIEMGGSHSQFTEEELKEY